MWPPKANPSSTKNDDVPATTAARTGIEARSSSLLDLPPELFITIINHLSRDRPPYSLISLSSTNKKFRELLAPHLFESVTLTNTARSAAFIQAMIRSQHAYCVKEIHYKGCLPKPDATRHIGGRYIPARPRVLPKIVQSTLSQLNRFPNLGSIIVEFPFENWFEFMNVHTFRERLETLAEVRKVERENGWRLLMRQSFDALCLNSEGWRVPLNLEIRQLPPCVVSTFETPAFQDLLRLVTGFSLSLRSYDHIAGHMNTDPFAAQLAARLAPWFFDHLNNVRTLVLEAPKDAPIGREGVNPLPLALRPHHMPHLRQLSAHNLFIGTELCGCISAHAGILEQVRLVDCMAFWAPPYEFAGAMAWRTFFDAILKAELTKLRKLEIKWTGEPQYLWWNRDWAREERRNGETEEIIRILRDNPKALIFRYVSVHTTWGTLSEESGEIRRCFLEQADQQAYQRLLDMVKRNRAESREQ